MYLPQGAALGYPGVHGHHHGNGGELGPRGHVWWKCFQNNKGVCLLRAVCLFRLIWYVVYAAKLRAITAEHATALTSGPRLSPDLMMTGLRPQLQEGCIITAHFYIFDMWVGMGAEGGGEPFRLRPLGPDPQ